ncbi:GNAT family N-acetyltransferase [Candidatus Poribacteria bacterium]
MKITCWDIADADELAHIYNEQTTQIPHCHPVSPEEFEAGIRYRKDIDEPYENLHSQQIIVGEYGGRIVGFADVAVVSNINEEGQKERQGLIRLLTYQRGCRPVGQALLEEAEKYLASLGEDQIKAFRISYGNDYCYRFYHLGFGLISDRVSHISALFRMNGYDVCGGEIFMSQPGYDLDEPIPPDDQVEIVVEKHPARGELPGLLVHALRGGSKLGTCRSLSIGDYCQSSEAQDWIFIKGLGVEEKEQAKGWGRYLLWRNLWEAKKVGYRNTAISCNIRNPRALLFYTNYGYRVADTAYGFVKNLC